VKKIILVLILLIPLNVKAISARNIIAMDMDTNRVLYGKNINDQELIASITKIMSSIIALEYGNLDSEVVVSDVILQAFGSAIYIEVGEKLTLKDLLYGLMLRSGNDAALMIADAVAGSVDNFVALMNNKAQELGMKNTIFINPHGLENDDGNGNLSTAYDMAILTSYAMQNENYKTIVSTTKYVAKSDKKTYVWKNKNKLLTTYQYTTGGKTGFTQKARRTLVSTASKDNKNIVVVSLNDPDDWEDHKYLYEDIFKNYNNELILDKNNFKIDNETYYKNDKLYIKDSVYILLKESEIKDIVMDFNLKKLTYYKNDECVGTVKIKLKDEVLKEVNIYVSKNNNKENKKSLLDKILGWFKND
jgi:D-alanyl-D-alanine carboxypeptidase